MIFTSEQTIQDEADSSDIERRMFQFLDAMPVGVIIARPDGKPYYANAEGMRLLVQDINPSAEVLEGAKAYKAYVARTDDKRRGRLNIITHLIDHIPHKKVKQEKIKLPKRQKDRKYREPDHPYKYVPAKY